MTNMNRTRRISRPATLLALALASCGDIETESETEATGSLQQSLIYATISVTGYYTAATSRSLLVAPGESYLDQDADGLVDEVENLLAQTFRPYVVFDSDEAARRSVEPVTVFQVRPVAHRGTRLTVRIKYVFLFRRDGGYGESSSCTDSHMGDNDDAWLELISTDNGTNFRLARVHLSFKNLEWPRTSGMSLYGYTHPKIYMSSHKHHEYFDTSYDGNDSYYSEWGCNDDVNGLGAAFLVDVSSLQRLYGYGNNIGEPSTAYRNNHPAAYFVDDLSTYFTEDPCTYYFLPPAVCSTPQKMSIWNGLKFYSLDPNIKKVMTFHTYRDEDWASNDWTPWTSEEGATYSPDYCPKGYLASSFGCQGSYCDNVRMYCQQRYLLPSSASWTGWFSEEGTNYRVCSSGFVTAVECSGSYCDAIRLECTTFAGVTPTYCSWTTGTLSEENGTMSFSGKFVAGIQCSGSYCDNKRFYVCSY